MTVCGTLGKFAAVAYPLEATRALNPRLHVVWMPIGADSEEGDEHDERLRETVVVGVKLLAIRQFAIERLVGSARRSRSNQ